MSTDSSPRYTSTLVVRCRTTLTLHAARAREQAQAARAAVRDGVLAPAAQEVVTSAGHRLGKEKGKGSGWLARESDLGSPR